ncbi:MAG TPA: hypothetical protein VM600_04800 [Actinomycetota bacterium]|nr:hypothetical protein [Actinomycetota bacterium]
MKRWPVSIALALLIASSIAAQGSHDTDLHSSNMELVATYNENGAYRQGTDLAFWGDTAVLGSFDNPGGFRLMDISDPTAPSLISTFKCAGNQADVSIWEDLVFVSVDGPRVDSPCGAAAAPASAYATGAAWEGVRVVSIDDPTNPVQIAAVKTDCGSHTHTLVPDPDNNRLLIYVLSYPISGQGVTCNASTHRKISIVEVPLDDPAAAKVLSTPSVAPAIGCHDVTVSLSMKIAGAACLTESQMWDISDPANPKIIAHIPHPAGMNLAHSTTFSMSGKTMVIGDELGGALATPGCLNEGHAPLGALWFYDVSDPTKPVQRGYMQLPRREVSLFCTAHNFNIIPVESKDLLVSGWYNGGTNIVDFSDPTSPKQIAYYAPAGPAGRTGSWSSYWYNGYIYSNNYDEDVYSSVANVPQIQRSRGFDVFRFTDPIVSEAVNVPYLNPQTQ